MSPHLFRRICPLLATAIGALTLAAAALAAGPKAAWGPYRGFNCNPKLERADFAALAATGANLVRVSFNSMPLMQREAPYAFDETALAKLAAIVGWCEELGLKIVIDPHTTPGTRRPYTTEPADAVWRDPALQDHLVRLWTRLAETYRNRGEVIAAYDLLNEPSFPADPGPEGWNRLVARLIAAIRATGDRHWIVVEPAVGPGSDGNFIDRMKGCDLLQLPDDDRLVVSPHMYQPFPYTHQGVEGKPLGIAYPGSIGKQNWDRARLERVLEPVVEFQRRTGVPVYLGEFSVSRHAADGDRYLADLIALFESHGWSWCYHDFRGSPFWDPEMPLGHADPSPRSAATPRMKLLRQAFTANHP